MVSTDNGTIMMIPKVRFSDWRRGKLPTDNPKEETTMSDTPVPPGIIESALGLALKAVEGQGLKLSVNDDQREFIRVFEFFLRLLVHERAVPAFDSTPAPDRQER